MPLPAPNLDDRRFQDLVDDAKRMVQQRCPEWTDHNVSDPGVTLIETFAYMVDQLLYRLNRVPDRNYLKFLELIGVRLFPPVAARAGVTFWLSAPVPETVVVPAGAEVATVRTETEDAVTFTVTEQLDIIPCSAEQLLAMPVDAGVHVHNDTLTGAAGFLCFNPAPRPGDALLIGLSDPVPRCAVAFRFDCQVQGVGVDPRNPPLRWEAWDGRDWTPCEVDRDETGGLNRAGDLVLHVPASHQASVIEQQRAGWIRGVVTEAEEGQPAYTASPQINELQAFTIGGTIDVIHAEIVDNEIIGSSEHIPGQRFALLHAPVVPGGGATILEVSAGEGWDEWTQVSNFADSGPDDRHYILDERAGEVILGPAVRQPDGSMTQYGAVPEKDAVLRIRSYRTGGGRRGNVARAAIAILKSAIPYVARVENRYPASGGVDGETVDEAKVRGPILMRTLNRAVTAEDYEQLTREAAPEVARVRCVAAGRTGDTDGATLGGVRVLVVPTCDGDERGRLRFEQLVPETETLARITRYLDERRVVGTRVIVEPPTYQGITVVASIKSRTRARRATVEDAAIQALYRYYHPITGGPEGTGWPFGRPVHVGEVYAVLQRVGRRGVHRGRPAVRGRPDHRAPGRIRAATGDRRQHPGVLLRAPGAGGRVVTRGGPCAA